MSSIVMVGHVEQRPIDQLLANANNARTHSAAQVDQIAASIREFGFVNPILIGPDHRIIAGSRSGTTIAKPAVAKRALPIVSVHVAPDTESQPVHPVKFESTPGAAVSVMAVPIV